METDRQTLDRLDRDRLDRDRLDRDRLDRDRLDRDRSLDREEQNFEESEDEEIGKYHFYFFYIHVGLHYKNHKKIPMKKGSIINADFSHIRSVPQILF